MTDAGAIARLVRTAATSRLEASAFAGTSFLAKLDARLARGGTGIVVASDIDHTFWLKGYEQTAQALQRELEKQSIPLAYVSGRGFSAVRGLQREDGLPAADVIASSVGTQRYLQRAGAMQLDRGFDQQIAARGFQKDPVRKLLAESRALERPGLRVELQPGNLGPEETNKLSYYVTAPRAWASAHLGSYQRALQERVGTRAKVVVAEDIHFQAPDQQRFCVDFLPVTKETSLVDLAGARPGTQVLTAGDSGNDAGLLLDVPAPGISVVVGGAKQELVREVLSRTEATAVKHLRKVRVPTPNGPIERLVYLGTHAPGDERGPESIARALELLLRQPA